MPEDGIDERPKQCFSNNWVCIRQSYKFDKTRNRLLCTPPISTYRKAFTGDIGERAVSYKPQRTYKPPLEPFVGSTETGDSFIEKKGYRQESYSPKRSYIKPTNPMITTSVYRETHNEKQLPLEDHWQPRIVHKPYGRGTYETEYSSIYNRRLDKEEMLAVRLAPIKQKDNLSPEKDAKMEMTTTTMDSYKGQRSTPVAAIRPKNRQLGDVEPFKGNTEQREAFTPKKIEHVTTYRLRDNNILSGDFSGCSGYKDEFQPRVAVKTKSFAPAYKYAKPSEKFSNETTNKSDFVPYNGVKKLPYTNANSKDHWNETQTLADAGKFQSTYKSDFPDEKKIGERVNYQPPQSTLKLGKESVELSTNYKDDFTFKASGKLKSYAPTLPYIRPGVKMDSSTEAHDSFTGKFIPPPRSFRPNYEVDPNRPRFDAGTTYNGSYKTFRFANPDHAV